VTSGNRLIVGIAVLGWSLGCGAVTGRAAGPSDTTTRKAPARLAASVDAVAPGSTFQVAIAYTLADDWHICWKNPGDSGAPPQVKWQLPDRFEVGELRFPAPRRHEVGPDDFKVVTFIHTGEPVLLTTLTAPPSLEPGSEVVLGAELTTLVGGEKTVQETQSISLRLPVVSDASAVKPAEAELFERAARQMPAADGKGKFITVTAAPSVKSVTIGAEFEVAVTVAIKPGHHIQSHRPYIPGLIATELIPERTTGVTVGKPVYPQPQEKMDRKLKMKLSEFHGQPVIRLPVEVNDEATGTLLKLAGVLTAQACTDETARCYPPETVAWSTTVELVGAPAAAPAGQAARDSAAAPGTAEAGGEGPADKTLLATTGRDQAGPPDAGAGAQSEEGLSLPVMLLFAALGGLILNVMPCVLPVISIKVLSFVQQADEDPRRVFRLGLVFALGILVSFWLLGAFAVGTKAAAGGTSWGEQFSRPAFVIVMTSIVFAFALSLFGVFEVTLPGAASGKLGAAASREGYPGALMKGMLATLLATPCTAPFLAPALAVAYTRSYAEIMAALTAVGVGMALPYVLLTAKPGWMRYLPRPGAWMESFKQFMGFVLMGTVVWLLWILGDLVGAEGLIQMIVFLTFLGLGCWLIGRIKLTWRRAGRYTAVVGAVLICLFGGWFAYGYMGSEDQGIDWVDYRPGLHKQLAAQGYTVYIDYTATWCWTCQLNKRVVLHTAPVEQRIRSLGVIAIKADFTDGSPMIAKDLREYGRTAVPLNLVLPANRPDEPIVLPVLLTQSIVLEALDEAGPSQAPLPPPAQLVGALSEAGPAS